MLAPGFMPVSARTPARTPIEAPCISLAGFAGNGALSNGTIAKKAGSAKGWHPDGDLIKTTKNRW
jgi:hypothetical protein